MDDQKLQKTYNKWWQSKTIEGENIDAAKRMYRMLLDGLEKYRRKRQIKILDVACGTGEFLIEAAKRGMKVYGIDLSDYAIAFAKKHIEGGFLVGSGEKLSFKDNSFDFVTCIGSLEHFPHPEKGISEMARVLRKGGVCLIHVPNLMFLGHVYMAMRYGVMPSEGKQSFSERFCTYNGWKDLLESHGFRVVTSTVYNDVSKTEKVSPLTKFIWHTVIRPIVPFNLSYAFNFYCQKNDSHGKEVSKVSLLSSV